MIRADNYFAILPEWILDADISAQAIRLYCVLARYAGKDGTCHPTRRTIADRLRVSANTVDRSMTELVGIGAVTVHQRTVPGTNEPTSNLYVVRTAVPGIPTDGDTSARLWAEGVPTDEEQRKAIRTKAKKNSPVPLAQDTGQTLASHYHDAFVAAHGSTPPQQSVKRIAQAGKQLLNEGHDTDLLRRAVEDCAQGGHANLAAAVTFLMARPDHNGDVSRQRKIDDCLEEARSRWPNGPENLLATWATAMRDKRAGRGPGPSIALYQLLDDTNTVETDA